MKGVENDAVDQGGPAASECFHHVFFAKPQLVQFSDRALARKGWERDLKLSECAGRKRANIGTARAGVEVLLGGREIEKPAQVGREKDTGVWPDDAELAACDRGTTAIEDGHCHPGATSCQ